MTYAPSGALVAAPTAGLPEQVGGTRNWDYRYTWVRDGSFSVAALLGLGFTEEAAAFGDWLRRRVEERAGDGSGPLKIMYRVDGSSDLIEETLDHFEGYKGSRPVRIGNARIGSAPARHLRRSDELDLCARQWRARRLGCRRRAAGTHIVTMVDWLCEHWHDPDEGIWETRGGRRRFVYGQLMSWVALDRAIRMANNRGRPADLQRWITERDRIHTQIMTEGWNDTCGAFVQYEGSDVLDASLVLMPLVGLHRAERQQVAVDPRRDGEDPRLRQPRVPLRPGRIAGRAPRLRRNLLALHVPVRRRARPLRTARRSAD